MRIPHKRELLRDIGYEDFMNLYKECTAYSFLVTDSTLANDDS